MSEPGQGVGERITLSHSDLTLPIEKIGFQKFHTQPLLKDPILNFSASQQFTFQDYLTEFSTVHHYYMAIRKNSEFLATDLSGVSLLIVGFPIILFYDQTNNSYSYMMSIYPNLNMTRSLVDTTLVNYNFTFQANTIYYVYLFSLYFEWEHKFSNFRFFVRRTDSSLFTFDVINIYRAVN